MNHTHQRNTRQGMEGSGQLHREGRDDSGRAEAEAGYRWRGGEEGVLDRETDETNSGEVRR